MTKLNVGFSNLTNDGIFHLALTVVHNVGAMLLFASLVPQLAPIATAAGALQAAMELPPGPVREQSIAAARATLAGLLTTLAGALQLVPNVTDAELAGTGFSLRQHATHTTQPPTQPTGVHLKAGVTSGTLQVLVGAVARAVMYEVQYTLDPVNGPWTDVPAFNSTRGMMLTGLTRGKDYYVHVRAVATGQNRGPWSAIASTTPQPERMEGWIPTSRTETSARAAEPQTSLETCWSAHASTSKPDGVFLNRWRTHIP